MRHVVVPNPGVLVVRLPFAWRRFPYALTTIAAAPRSLPGPFRLVRGSRNEVELARGGVHLLFRRLRGAALLRALGRGELDEAPLPLGDVGSIASTHVHTRPLLAVDVVAFRSGAVPEAVRNAYWQTANRGDYEALVAENGAAAALGLVGATESADPAAFRRAIGAIRTLPPMSVRVAVPADPTLQYGARLLYAQWREVGLGPKLIPRSAAADAELVRDAAVYPQDEALLGPLHLATALGADDQRAAFDRLDADVRRSARVIPVCWVSDARWVSPRLRGWREDVLGDVDYTRVTVR